MPLPPRKLLCLLALVIAAAAPLLAQSTEDGLKMRLMGKPLYLRGCYSGNKLHFDGNGALIGQSKTESFTLSGFDLRELHVKAGTLLLEGKRIGTEFVDRRPKRVRLDNMKVEIDSPAGGDYSAALGSIFADGIEDLSPQLPRFWQLWTAMTFPREATPVPLPDPSASTGPEQSAPQSTQDASKSQPVNLLRPVAPTGVSRKEPTYGREAQDMQYGGNVTLMLIIRSDGRTERIRVIAPIGLGLDEAALAAVEQWQFKPATLNSKPVSAEVMIDVGFNVR